MPPSSELTRAELLVLYWTLESQLEGQIPHERQVMPIFFAIDVFPSSAF